MLLDCFTWWRTRHPNTLLLTVISTLPQQILWGITATTIFSQQNQICRVLLWITSALYAVIPPLSSVLAAKWFDTGKNWFFMGYVVWVFSHINNYHCSSFGNWTVFFFFNKKILVKIGVWLHKNTNIWILWFLLFINSCIIEMIELCTLLFVSDYKCADYIVTISDSLMMMFGFSFSSIITHLFDSWTTFDIFMFHVWS